MWTPAKFMEWARDPLHPYYRVGHPRDGNHIMFLLDGKEISTDKVTVASSTNGYLRVFVFRADGSRMTEQVGKTVRFMTRVVKGRVDIMVSGDEPA